MLWLTGPAHREIYVCLYFQYDLTLGLSLSCSVIYCPVNKRAKKKKKKKDVKTKGCILDWNQDIPACKWVLSHTLRSPSVK